MDFLKSCWPFIKCPNKWYYRLLRLTLSPVVGIVGGAGFIVLAVLIFIFVVLFTPFYYIATGNNIWSKEF